MAHPGAELVWVFRMYANEFNKITNQAQQYIDYKLDDCGERCHGYSVWYSGMGGYLQGAEALLVSINPSVEELFILFEWRNEPECLHTIGKFVKGFPLTKQILELFRGTDICLRTH
jgi:hypothetical protein